MPDYFAKFLEVDPSLNLPADKEVTGAMESANRGLSPRLYLIPQPLADVGVVEGLPAGCAEDEVVWVGMEVDPYGFPHYLGHVDPAATLRGLRVPKPTALIRSLVYRQGTAIPQEVYIFSTETPYLTGSEPAVDGYQK